MNRVVWSTSALAQLRSIRAYLERFNPIAAGELAKGLMAAGNGLVIFPHRGRPVPATDKREAVMAYPYIIRYRGVGGTVRILRVRHTSRRPTNP
ncbi:MAG: type II toxin-antitoxin system RelE/ParE family toxin [Acetobacteraceae bacterium]|nr:type II toxin-antitoxin system RelE/ParE family toxin [Acetobacteraceae bacterium]